MADNEMKIALKVDTSQMTQAMRQVQQLQNSVGNPSGDFGAGAMGRATGSLGAMAQGWLSNSIGIGTLTTAITPAGIAVQALAGGIKAAGALAVESVKDYANFEGTLKQVQIIAGGTQADMDMLGETAIKVGGSTSKGAQEVAEAMVDFAKLGFTAEETAVAMTGIVYAAEASGSSVETTAQIVATSLNVWGMAASEAEHVADVLAKTSNETAADMTDLGYTLQYAGSSASLAGASMEQLSAMAGIMADNGIRGSKAGTSLRTAFTNLIAPTDGAMTAMENLGVAWQDAEGKARPTMDVIRDLQDATQGLSDIEIQDLSTKLFGKPGAAGMSFVLKTTRDELDGLTTSLENSTGTAARQAAEMRETMEGQLDQLGDSWDAIKLKIGKGITGTVALAGVESLNGMLDILSSGIDAFAEGFSATDKLLNESNGFISGYKDAKALGDIISDSGRIAKLAGDDYGTMFTSVDSGTKLAVKKFKELEAVTGKVQWLPDEAVEKYIDNNAEILSITAGTIQDLKVKLATFASSAKTEGGIGQALKESIIAGTPAMGDALAEQVNMVKQAEETKFNAIATALANNTELTDQQRSDALSKQKEYHTSIETEVQNNSSKIWELYQNLDTQTVADREASLAEIERLQTANGQRLVEVANITSSETLGVLRLQAESAGFITQQQKDKAIADSEETYTQTVTNAYKTWNESVTAINGMSDDAILATGKTKTQLIADATEQRDTTVTKAEEMRTGTVNAINEMEVRATEADGKTITMETRLANFDNTMRDLGSLIRKMLDLWDAVSKVADFMGNVFTDPFKSNDQLREEFENDRKAAQASKKSKAVYGPNPIKKARGGLTSGVAGLSKGATLNPNASARGVGTQLGQGGVPQARGVISGERGMEATIPIGNTTYMKPFAKAIASELGIGDVSQTPEIIVPLYINSKEFALATSKDIAEQMRGTDKLANRAKGAK